MKTEERRKTIKGVENNKSSGAGVISTHMLKLQHIELFEAAKGI